MVEVIKERKNKVNYSERVEKDKQEENAIEYCERLYPETTKEFKKILDEITKPFVKNKETTDQVTSQLGLI